MDVTHKYSKKKVDLESLQLRLTKIIFRLSRKLMIKIIINLEIWTVFADTSIQMASTSMILALTQKTIPNTVKYG